MNNYYLSRVISTHFLTAITIVSNAVMFAVTTFKSKKLSSMCLCSSITDKNCNNKLIHIKLIKNDI